MKPTGSAADFVPPRPPRPTITRLRAAARGCRGCELYRYATQTVFGAGPPHARMLIVGEQPGDVEDIAGLPFVGPSGKLLDKALDAAGIDRGDVYVTNAVKHFKFARDARSERRLHKSPNVGEVRACRPWLEQEIDVVAPDVILCLGATAAKSLLGSAFSVMKQRGVAIESEWAKAVFTTVHPSAVLRSPSGERAAAEQAFTADIAKAAGYLGRARPVKAPRQRRSSSSSTSSSSSWPTTARRSRTSSGSTRSSRA